MFYIPDSDLLPSISPRTPHPHPSIHPPTLPPSLSSSHPTTLFNRLPVSFLRFRFPGNCKNKKLTNSNGNLLSNSKQDLLRPGRTIC